MIKYLKKDFGSVRAALECKFGKKIPFGIALLYYTIVGIIVLPFVPIILLIYHIQLRRLRKMLEGYSKM